jgi:hypothetical protein
MSAGQLVSSSQSVNTIASTEDDKLAIFRSLNSAAFKADSTHHAGQLVLPCQNAGASHNFSFESGHFTHAGGNETQDSQTGLLFTILIGDKWVHAFRVVGPSGDSDGPVSEGSAKQLIQELVRPICEDRCPKGQTLESIVMRGWACLFTLMNDDEFEAFITDPRRTEGLTGSACR